MIDYYRLPQKRDKLTQKEVLKVVDDADLKDAIYSKAIERARVVSFRNSSIKDQSLGLLRGITGPLCVV